VTCERCTLPDLRSWLGKKRRHVLGYDLVCDVVTRSVVLLVGVFDRPSAALCGIVIGCSILGSLEYLLDSLEAVAVEVVFTADLLVVGDDIDLNDLVVETIDHGVNAVRENLMDVSIATNSSAVDSHVLVVLGSNAGRDFDLVGRVARLVGAQRVCVNDTSSLDLELDRAIERKVEVEAVLSKRQFGLAY
jgi:hypothetical protein